MAKTNAERQRDYRARQREKQGTVRVMLVSEHEKRLAEVRLQLRQEREQVTALQEALTLKEQSVTLAERLEHLLEHLTGERQEYTCPEHGCELACRDCDPEAFGLQRAYMDDGC